MSTPNLDIGFVAPNQNQKEVTINSAFTSLDNAQNASLTVDCTVPTAGVITLTAAQYVTNGTLRLTGAPGSAFTVNTPDTKRLILISNESGQNATLQSTSGGTSTVIPSGFKGIFVNYSADIRPFALASSAGGGAIATDADVILSSVADEDELYYDGSSSVWRNGRPKYIVGTAALTGAMLNGQVLLLHKFTKGVTFPANFGAYRGHTSVAGGTTNATATTVITANKAPAGSPTAFSSVGTITVAASSVGCTFASAGGSAVSFAQGDVLQLVGPATADATFADFFATLVGYET